MVKVNGEMSDAAGRTVSELLEHMGFSDGRVAVELNESIVPKSEYEKTILKDSDSVEVVRFVGGG
ncbi:MAG: sulfur carrier protein ThiS [Alistipes sp.]|nr:sulfur carrier protein ThiS [Alistipes sp.]